MKAIERLPEAEARALDGLLFDLDDTLLSDGQLTKPAYDALWALSDAGLVLVAVTGRPSGWGEVIARQWPIAGAVTENGAVAVVRSGRGVERRERCDPMARRERRAQLAALVEKVQQLVPEARLSDDAHARVSDITWDIGERHVLPRERVDTIADAIRSKGGRTTRSSVHLHATFDTDDKASGSVAFLNQRGVDAAAALRRYAFIGDSGNDASCFAAFATTFAVANIAHHLCHLTVAPRYLAHRRMGEGFAEVARTLLERRRGVAAARV